MILSIAVLSLLTQTVDAPMRSPLATPPGTTAPSAAPVEPFVSFDRVAARQQLDTPKGFHHELKRSLWALITGGALLALTYLPLAVLGVDSAVTDRNGSYLLLLLPGIGPPAGVAAFLATQPPCTGFCLSIADAELAIAVAAGILQAVGVILTAYGLPLHDELVRD